MKISGVNILYKDEIIFGNITFDSKIVNIEKLDYKKTNKLLIPGLIDLHTHGGKGKDFNTINSKDDIGEIINFYYSCGVTSVLPTVMTDSVEILKEKLSLIGNNAKYYPSIKGIHLEGPFLSKEYKGAHEERYLQPLDTKLFGELIKASGNYIRYLTVAPELNNNKEFIEFSIKNNIVVNLGHSNATYSDCVRAKSYGASGFTHTFNAMRPFNHHSPSILLAALDLDGMYDELICDLKHVDPIVMKYLIKEKGVDNVVGITDSLMCAGLKNGDYLLGSQPITLVDGDCYIKGTTTRAGSCLRAIDGVKNLYNLLNKNIVKAVKMYTKNPAKHLGIFDETGSIEAGKASDFVLIDKDFNVLETYVKGEKMYGKSY